MKNLRRKRNNPDYRYTYYIFKPVFTIGGDEDIEVLSSRDGEDENDISYAFARDFERQWSSLEFGSVETALEFMRELKLNNVEDAKGSHRRKEYLVNPAIITDLYLYNTKYQGMEVEEILGGEDAMDSETANFIKFVAYIGYNKIEE